MDPFKLNRTLLNPKFEGYKLDPILQEKAVRRYTLSRRPTQATASTRSPLAFEEMRSRISHNHLCVENTSGCAVYVDDQYMVCLINVPTSRVEEDAIPSFRSLYEMPTPMNIPSDSVGCTIQKEYPSCTFIGSGAVAVADGGGLLYVLPIKDDPGPVEPVGIFTLRTGGVVDTPFRIHYCHRISPIIAVLLLSSRHYSEKSGKSSTGHNQIEFDIWAVEMKLLSLSVNPPQQNLQVIWHRRGRDVPIYTTFVEAVNAYLLIGGSSYPDPNTEFAKHYEPTLGEMAPIPREGENHTTSSTLDEPEKPYPYSWTQTSDTITVAFPLPSSTPKTSMKVTFTMQSLTLTVDTHHYRGGEASTPTPHYVTKSLWDNVDPSACFWTWDREAEHAYGLLTLHMEKKNEGTRWMQVFATSATSAGDDVEVPECVDPSEMVKIRESLEKWTASISSGEDASGLGLGKGVPSLMDGEMDEEVDAHVGRTALLTWVGEGGQTPDWWLRNRKANTEDETAEYWEAPPITLLSTPFPGTMSASGDLELLLKHDLDGTAFSFKTTDPPVWEHTSTYSALAFVLASKRDTRFTHHISSRGVMAFEGGSLRDRSANLYIYRPSTTEKDKWAKQSVIQVDGGGGGAVLGVGCLEIDNGKEVVIVCLTERELVLIRGI